MLRAELEHLIRVACEALGEEHVLVFGSQAVLGTYGEYELPEVATFSEEADIVPAVKPEHQAECATLIDAALGELSPFHQLHGYYAQGIERRTALLSPGWADRLVAVRNEGTDYRTGWCLEVHDLCSSKLLANRDKDREFVRALIESRMVDVATLRDRLTSTRVDVGRQQRALDFLNPWRGQPPVERPAVPFIPTGLPTHPARLLPADELTPDYRDADTVNE